MSTIAERTRHPLVLLIDDNRGDAMLTTMAFKKAATQTTVVVASSAEAALERLRGENDPAGEPLPDLILLDLNLPQVSGLEFLKVLKADETLRLIPVIALSSSDAERDIRSTYGQYVNGFIVKPFSMADYGEVVTTVEDYWVKLIETPVVRT